MHVITRRALTIFSAKYPTAKLPLDAWYKLMCKITVSSLPEVKSVFPATDYVDGLYVFDIGGNKYRLIAKMEFLWKKVFITHVLTHKEYDTGKWKQTISKKRGNG